MKNVYTACARLFFLLLIMSMLQLAANAQAWTIAVCSGTPSVTTSNVYGPMYSVATANATSREAVIYPASQLTGIAGQTLSNAYFNRFTASGSMAGTPNFKIYLKEVSATDWGSTALDWATAITGATLVYDGDPTAAVGSTAGWKNFPFSTTFPYSGAQNLAVFFEYKNTTASTAIAWSYEYTSTCVNTANSNTTKYSNVTTGTLPTSLASTNYRRPYIGFDYTVAPCTTPPTAGAATANPTSGLCTGSSISLGLAGNSSGTGQTYIWQKSTNLTPPHTWTDISSSSASGAFSTPASTTAFYRAAVTCGGATRYSDSVKVTVNPAFPGGTYTINPGNPTGGNNFQTFADAISALNCGIAGPVLFQVANATYNEQVTIPAIGGTSSTNTVTFKGNLATLSFSSTTSTNRAGIILNGADHIIIDSLNVDGSAGTYGWGIVLMNQADSNVISHCNITVSTASTVSADHAGILITGSASAASTSGNNGNGNIIENNTITGGYYGIYLYGSTAPYNVNNVVRNNIVNDFYYYSIYNYGQESATISGNDISRPSRTSFSSYNVYVSTNNGGIKVEKNKIHDLFQAGSGVTAILYNIYIGASGTAAKPNSLENNLVYNINNSNGTIYGVYGLAYNYWNYYHNTIALDDPNSTAGTTYALYVYGSTAVNVKNNIIYITRGGTGTKYCLYYSTTGVTSSNNNVLFMGSTSGTNGIGYFTSGRTTLADWQVTGFDLNSSAADPVFVGGGDYKPTEPTINNIGASGVGVTTDITGALRGASPDPGAYEFSVVGTDAGISWVSPVMPATTGLKTITVAITNNSSSGNVTAVNLSYTDGTIIQTQNFTGLSIAPLATQNLSFTTQYNVTGNTYFTAYINSVNGSNDLSQANDTTRQSLCFALNGTYTINQNILPSSTNFPSFTAAMNALACGGVSGPVVFKVVAGSGPYVDQVVIPQFNGASTTNTVTIKGNLETIAYNTSDANNRTAVILNGADHVIIDSLNIDVSAGTYGWGIVLTSQADSNIIRNCTITSSITSALTNYAGIQINGSASTTSISGNNGNGNLIENNTVIGGYYGIYLYGGTSPYNLNNRVRNNIIQDYYYYSIYNYGQQFATISKNDISRPSRTNFSSYNVYTSTNNGGIKIEKNRIHDLFAGSAGRSTTVLYNIYVAASGTATDANSLENNLVYNINNTDGTIYGVYGLAYNYWNYYHNTIVLDEAAATAGTTYGMYVYGATSVNVKNNIIYIARGGTGTKYCLYYSTTGVTSSNNNDLYMGSTSGTNGIGYLNSGYTTLANWQAANGAVNDQQSLSIDPAFIYASATPPDYTPTNSLLNNMGAPVGVTTDIRDSTRSATTPDVGAYEFSTLTAGINMSAEALITPSAQANGCYSNAETVTIRIRNSSTSTIDFAVNPVTVTVNVGGAVTQTLTKIINTGTLASDQTMDVVIPTTLDMSLAGTYVFNASTNVTGDVNTANDAMLPVSRTKNTLAAGTSAASPDAYCAPSPTNPTLASPGVNGYSSLQWLQSTTATGGYAVIGGATTIPYTIASALSQTMYYRLVARCGTTNDTSAAIVVAYNNPQVLTTSPASRCGTGSVTLQATGSAGTTLDWYQAASGGAPLASGTTFATPGLASTTTYYVSATAGGGGLQTVGPNDLSIGTFATWTSTAQWLNFSVLSAATIQSVDMFWSGTVGSNFTIVIRDATSSATVFTYNGTTTVTGTTTPQVVPINAALAPGTYQMNLSGTNPGTYRNSTGGVYPYAIPGIISITGNTFDPAYYYMFYRWQVSTGCQSARSAVIATINPSASNAAGAVGSTECATATVSGSTEFNFTDCDPIAIINPSGGTPVSGSVNACVKIDASVQLAPNNQPYVQRHYDITPAVNPTTATSTITLYYLQSEFTAFNAARGIYPALPTGSADAAGKANLKITQYGGTGTAPGNYTGTATQIDPADANIVWNAIASRWEITFNATGSGAFYVHTGNFVLPVTIVSFHGEKIGSVNKLSWTSKTETNNAGFELQRSADGRTFSTISYVATKADNGNSTLSLDYISYDEKPLGGNNYYRLKQVDRDGKFTYSQIVLLETKVKEIVLTNVYPNPATTEVNLVILSPRAEKLTVVITDLTGKIVAKKPISVISGENKQSWNIQSLASGSYLLKAVCANGCETALYKFVKQ